MAHYSTLFLTCLFVTHTITTPLTVRHELGELVERQNTGIDSDPNIAVTTSSLCAKSIEGHTACSSSFRSAVECSKNGTSGAYYWKQSKDCAPPDKLDGYCYYNEKVAEKDKTVCNLFHPDMVRIMHLDWSYDSFIKDTYPEMSEDKASQQLVKDLEVDNGAPIAKRLGIPKGFEPLFGMYWAYLPDHHDYCYKDLLKNGVCTKSVLT